MTLGQQFQFTPAAQRAVTAADATGLGRGRIGTTALLAGLLEEPESRAAGVLAEHGVTAEVVLDRWPELLPPNPHPSPSRSALTAPLETALVDVVIRWSEFVAQVEVATEHLLLAILGVADEVADWLARHGLAAATFERDLLALHGHRPGPLVTDDVPAVGEPEGTSSAPLLRIIDAAANRGREALRVVEDYVRFVLDDATLSGECKSLRHALQTTLAYLPNLELLAARETTADVGTTLTTSTELLRVDAEAVVTANFKRLEESLRSLEEYTKVIDPALAATLEQLRYRTYTLERAVGISADSRERWAGVRLYVLLDGRARLDEFERLARTLVDAGVHAIQLRDKTLGDRPLLERARWLRHLTREAGVLLIVNDRPDLAVLCDADGVHVGQEELSVKDARSIVGPRRLVGASTHSLEQARAAVLEGANYLGVGPVFPSHTKSFRQFVGVDLLKDVAREVRLPALAIGGIDPQNIGQVLATGFERVAVSAAVCEAADPAAVVRQLLAALDQAASR